MKKIQIFTEIEFDAEVNKLEEEKTNITFNSSTFNRIDSVVEKLKMEGWEVYHSEDFVNKDNIVLAKKYKFVRYI